jgi:hypothetical protein
VSVSVKQVLFSDILRCEKYCFYIFFKCDVRCRWAKAINTVPHDEKLKIEGRSCLALAFSTDNRSLPSSFLKGSFHKKFKKETYEQGVIIQWR